MEWLKHLYVECKKNAEEINEIISNAEENSIGRSISAD